MNRRAFLALASAAAAGAVFDVERALWVPGRKTYFDIVRPVSTASAWGIFYHDPNAFAAHVIARALDVPTDRLFYNPLPSHRYTPVFFR